MAPRWRRASGLKRVDQTTNLLLTIDHRFQISPPRVHLMTAAKHIFARGIPASRRQGLVGLQTERGK
jgi:hypothetical protein